MIQVEDEKMIFLDANAFYSYYGRSKLGMTSEPVDEERLKKYLEQGEVGLENKKKPGNPLSKYMNKKQLSDIEKLEYENMKLRIENERLKKGYMVEGDGQVVIFNGSKNKNSK